MFISLDIQQVNFFTFLIFIFCNCSIICRHIDDNQETYVKKLAEVVAIESVSAWEHRRDETIRMVEETAKVDLTIEH